MSINWDEVISIDVTGVGQIPCETANTSILTSGEVIETDGPQIPPSQPCAFQVEDLPTTPILSRGTIVGTGIQFSNENRDHVCDVAVYIRRSMAGARFYVGQVAQAIREAIKALLKSLGFEPAAGGIANYIKSLAQYVKRLTRLISDINDAVDVFVGKVREIRAIIEYILALPANLLAMFQSCLKEAYAELAAGFLSIASEIAGPDSTSNELSDSAKDLFNETQALASQTVELLGSPVKVLEGAINPSSMTEQEKEQLVTDLFAAGGTNVAKYDSSNYGLL